MAQALLAVSVVGTGMGERCDDRLSVCAEKYGQSAAVAGADIEIIDAGLFINKDSTLPAESAALIEYFYETLVFFCHVTARPLPLL